MNLSHERYLETIAKESAALATAARGNLDDRVPSCPEWKMSDLVAHIGEVQRFWGEIARRGLTDPRATERHDPPTSIDLVQWFLDGAHGLVETLRDIDLEREIWTWSRERTIAFVPRRMAQEVAVHGWDARNAVGDPSPIATDVAVDGIDELLSVWLPAMAPLKEAPSTSLHLHTTDAEGEWLVVLEEEPVVTREHAKGDAAVRGPASDLFLWMWGRVPPEALEIHGDPAVLEQFCGFFDLE
ncbi:MAG: maleylpyruvate isomerase family mycothiol-dependent enzyme [Actinomycetota bacterium]